VRAHFEFMDKLGVNRWCFHDRDIAPDAKTLPVYARLFSFLNFCNLQWKPKRYIYSAFFIFVLTLW
jgi:xylose isomerase